MKILVTGSAGFIGSYLVQGLLQEGCSVVGIDNLNSYYDISLKFARLRKAGIDFDNKVLGNSNYQFAQVDICDFERLERLFSDTSFDMVIHLAAQAGVRYSIEHPQEYVQSNMVGFFNVLECCRKFGVDRLLYASSSSVYGNSESEIFRESDVCDSQESLYAVTKKSNELMAHSYHKLYGISTIGMRFFTVYGAMGRPDMAPMLFSEAIMSGRPIKVFNHGDLWRDFTYIEDLVNRILKIVLNFKTPTCEVYNIGSSRPILLGDFISTLEKSLGMSVQKEFLPMQCGDVFRTYASMEKFERDFGKCDVATPFEEGIARFANWYKEWFDANNN